MTRMGGREGAVAVCGDPEAAAVLVAGGARVVFCGTDAARLATTLITLRDAGGRVAGLIGDLADPEVEAAAVAMASELFAHQSGEPGQPGQPVEPVVVRSVSEAGQQMAKPPAPEGT